MDSKIGLGILVVFVAVIVALALYSPIGQYVSSVQETGWASNVTVTPATAAGSFVDLFGQEYLGTSVVTNATGGEIVASGNMSVSEGISATTGVKTVILTTGNETWAYASSVNVTYNYAADGYIDSAGGRAMANLIPIFAALAIAMIAIFAAMPGLRELVGL